MRSGPGLAGVVVLLMVVAYAAALGALGASPAAAYTVTGLVTDAASGQPLSGVGVSATCGPPFPPEQVTVTTTTGADGRYSAVVPIAWLVDYDGCDFGVLGLSATDAAGRYLPGAAIIDMWDYTTEAWAYVAPSTIVVRDLALARESTPPVTTQTGGDAGWQKGPVTVLFEATDVGSGVDHTEYRVNGRTWASGTSVRFALVRHKRGPGSFTLDYRSVDKAGNVEAYQTCLVQLF